MKIKELLRKESNWTQKVAARNKLGSEVDSRSRTAVQWCLFGAVEKCYLHIQKKVEIRNMLRDEIQRKFGESPDSTISIAKWNDSSTRKFSEVREIIEALDI